MAIDVARKLRKRMTPQEVKLWVRLRALRPRGFHFRRQAPLEGYIVDFVCFRKKLVVEVDGGQHGEAGQKYSDTARDEKLSRAGFRIMRLWNNDLDENIDGVTAEIVRVLERD
jgi:very-short-patch-repair endonuclease